jgi:hypothetical protein
VPLDTCLLMGDPGPGFADFVDAYERVNPVS